MHYFLRDQWLGTDEEVRAHIPGGEPVNPAGSFTWLKLGSAQTLLQQEGIFKWPLMTSALLSLLEGIFRIVPPLLKCVLSHIKCPKTWHPTSTLPCSSHLSSLLYFLRFLLNCFLFFKFSSFVSCSPLYHPAFPLKSFIVLLLLQPFHNLLSIFLFPPFHSFIITKCPVFSFPKHCFLRNHCTLLQLKNQVFSIKSCNC